MSHLHLSYPKLDRSTSWLVFIFGFLALASTLKSKESLSIHWKPLASIPDPHGFAAPFSGVSGDKLLVAGGANFPDKMPWNGGIKVWHDRIFALSSPNGSWSKIGKLPRPIAYGASLTLPQGLLCIGGNDSSQHFAEVFLIRVVDQKLQFESFPSLPISLSYLAAILHQNQVYVAGGLESPKSTQTSSLVFRLNLDKLNEGWKSLPSLPGPRFLGTLGIQDSKLHYVGGASYHSIDPETQAPVRNWHREIFQYNEEKDQWLTVATLPRPAVATPQPLPITSSGELVILGGDDGSQLQTPPMQHPGFPKSGLLWKASKPREFPSPHTPFSLVTTTLVPWQNGIVICGGELKPGIRSTDVWFTQDLHLLP